MLRVEDALGLDEVELVLGLFRPRQGEDPVEVIADDGVISGGGRNLLQPVGFLQSDALRLVGQGRGLDALAEAAGFGGAGVGIAQLALDGAQLLPKIKIPLRLRDRSGDVVLDFRAKVKHLQFALEHRQQVLEPVLHGSGFEEPLAFFEAEVERGGDEVGELAGVVEIERGELLLLRQGGRELDDFLELLLCATQQGVHFQGLFLHVFEHLEVRAQIRLALLEIGSAHAPKPLHEDADGVVRELEHP